MADVLNFGFGIGIHPIWDLGFWIADCERMVHRADRIALNFSEISELATFTPGALLLAAIVSSDQLPAASIEDRGSKNRRTAEYLDSSRSPVKTDGYVCPFDNDRNFAASLGVFQHGVKMFGLFGHVTIIYLAAFFGKSFTSCPGIRSSIFSEKQNFVGHFFLPGWPVAVVGTLAVELATGCPAAGWQDKHQDINSK